MNAPPDRAISPMPTGAVGKAGLSRLIRFRSHCIPRNRLVPAGVLAAATLAAVVLTSTAAATTTTRTEASYDYDRAAPTAHLAQITISPLPGSAAAPTLKDPARWPGSLRPVDSLAAKTGTAIVRYDADFALGQLTRGGAAKASDLVEFGTAQGWRRVQTATGPIKYVDANDVARLTIKRGSPRAPGSNFPHVELRNAAGQRVDPLGRAVTRRSPGNHTPIDWDLR